MPGHRGHGEYDHDRGDQGQRAQRRRLQVQVGTGQQVAVGQAVPDPDDQADAERDGLRAAAPPAARRGTGRRAGCRSARRCGPGWSARGPARPAPASTCPGPAAARAELCLAALAVRLTTRESASRHRPPNSSTWASGSLNVLRLVYCSGRLSASTAAAAGAQRGPASRPASPPNESTAHAADQRRGHQRGRDPAQPDRRGQHHRHPGHELRHDPGAARVVVDAGERQARVRAAERGQRVRVWAASRGARSSTRPEGRWRDRAGR